MSSDFKVFRCPFCQEYMSTLKESCPKCGAMITDDQKQQAIKQEQDEVKSVNRSFYKKSLYVGIALFLGGGAIFMLFLIPFLMGEEARLFIWSPIITLIGLGEIIYSLTGLYKER